MEPPHWRCFCFCVRCIAQHTHKIKVIKTGQVARVSPQPRTGSHQVSHSPQSWGNTDHVCTGSGFPRISTFLFSFKLSSCGPTLTWIPTRPLAITNVIYSTAGRLSPKFLKLKFKVKWRLCCMYFKWFSSLLDRFLCSEAILERKWCSQVFTWQYRKKCFTFVCQEPNLLGRVCISLQCHVRYGWFSLTKVTAAVHCHDCRLCEVSLLPARSYSGITHLTSDKRLFVWRRHARSENPQIYFLNLSFFGGLWEVWRRFQVETSFTRLCYMIKKNSLIRHRELILKDQMDVVMTTGPSVISLELRTCEATDSLASLLNDCLCNTQWAKALFKQVCELFSAATLFPFRKKNEAELWTLTASTF